jgi:putative transposase
MSRKAATKLLPRERARARRTAPGQQIALPLRRKAGRGGKRKNAGRKSRSGISPVARVRRPLLGANHVVHVNWRVLPHVWNLRSRRGFRVILRAFAATAQRLGFRVTHFSVMGNHIHLIVEVDGTAALSRGMQALAIRLAKGLNKMMGRKGAVFSDRFHAHALGSPAEVRNAIAYVMNNARIHAERQGRPAPKGDDAYAVGPTHLRDPAAAWRAIADAGPPVIEPRGWLLSEGWLLG